MTNYVFWLPEEDERLRELAADGRSKFEISRGMGGRRSYEGVAKRARTLGITLAAPTPRLSMGHISGGWTDERVELLFKLAAEGLSRNQIAERLGGVTRNAVIGKCNRLGISGAVRGYTPKSRKRARLNAGPRPVRPQPRISWLFMPAGDSYVPSAEELVIPLAERKSIVTLEEGHCRWPIGDPKEADFHFCGKSKVIGLSYCEFHARRAYQPPQPRRVSGGNPMPVRAQLPWLMGQQLDEVTA